MDKLNNIKVSTQEKNEIKKDSPDTLPLNPTAQGYSGAEIRRRLSKSITGEEGSVLSLFIDKMNIISDLFHMILDESDDNSIIEQLKKKISKDGSVAMEGDLNLGGNDIDVVNSIWFEQGGFISNFDGNDFTICLPNGEVFRFSENGLNMSLRKLTDVEKGVNSKDGANMENINDIKRDVDDLETKIGNIKNGTIIVKKAEQDKNGNDIVTTYETKNDATNKLALKANKKYVDDALDGKLDNIWTDLTIQTTPILTDEFVLNRGNDVYKMTLATMLSNAVETEIFVVAQELPAVGQVNKIYLVPSNENQVQNSYYEFIWIFKEDIEEYGWERIGIVSVDLSNYYNKTQVEDLLETKLESIVSIWRFD